MTRVATLLRLMVANEALWAGGIAAWLVNARDWPLLAALLVGVATPLAVHAAIVGWNFVIASLAGSPTPPAHRLGFRRAASLYLREVVDSIIVFQWAQPWLASLPLASAVPGAAPGGTADSTDARVPVLLVHGYFCNRQVWRAMAAMLAARGHVVAAVDLEPVFASIDDYVPIIDRAIDALAQCSGATRVALVCHSMGGLAARAYLRAHGTARIARVITLGTPHRGTAHARFGLGANARQMCPASDWLTALAASEPSEARALFTVVFSHHDNIVSPQAGQTIANARVIEVSGLGHLTLARAPEIGRTVIAELERG